MSDPHRGSVCLLPFGFGPQLSSVTKLPDTLSKQTHLSIPSFVMGNAFPFASLSSISSSLSSPSLSSSRPPPSRPSHPVCLAGVQFPFLSPATKSPSAHPIMHRSLGLWIAHHGGRTGFCVWLRGQIESAIGVEGLHWSAADVWDSLLGSGDRWHDVQVETVLEEHPDFMESELNKLVSQAQSTNPGELKRPPKRRRAVASPAIQAAHLSRCQRRNAMKRHHRAALRVARQKHKKRLACARTSELFGVKKERPPAHRYLEHAWYGRPVW